MSLNASDLAAQMLTAFRGSFSKNWPEIKTYAQAESKKLAENFLMIEALVLSGEINATQAKLHHDIQRNATRSVLLAIEGLGLIAVEEAINAAMDVLKESINTALKFPLL
jgi:hypothetical protein